MANFLLKLRPDDGAQIESKGKCSDAKAFALYMVNCFADAEDLGPDADDKPHVAEFRAAVSAFMAACAKYRDAVGVTKKNPSPTSTAGRE